VFGGLQSRDAGLYAKTVRPDVTQGRAGLANNSGDLHPRLDQRAFPAMSYEDPLWKLRHALAGVALALVLAVLAAALLGSAFGDLVAGTYGARVAAYSALLLYVVVGAGVLFAKVAQHETRPLSAGRVALWFASLWLWPLLLMRRAPRGPDQS